MLRDLCIIRRDMNELTYATVELTTRGEHKTNELFLNSNSVTQPILSGM